MPKTETTTNISIRFGAFCEPIKEQLHKAGLGMDTEKLEHFQKDADALVRLSLRDIIPFSACDKARQRLLNKIAKEAENE